MHAILININIDLQFSNKRELRRFSINNMDNPFLILWDKVLHEYRRFTELLKYAAMQLYCSLLWNIRYAHFTDFYCGAWSYQDMQICFTTKRRIIILKFLLLTETPNVARRVRLLNNEVNITSKNLGSF